MSVSEAALFWGLSKSYVRRLCAMGRVPSARKIKGKWLMDYMAAKPFDRRFKKPTMTVIEILSPTPPYRRLCDYKNFTVINGLIVLLADNISQAA